ncbi:MAG: FxsA family protein, partial [Lacipirellulaceae bacterium]
FLALNALRGELVQGRLPADKVIDGVLILIAGVVLITPGILTDIVGLSLLLPPVRSAVRKFATAWLTKRVQVTTTNFWQGFAEEPSPYVERPPQAEMPKGEVIDARVVETRVEE